MNAVLWAFVGLVVCMFVIVVVIVYFAWDKAEETGIAKGRGEMVQDASRQVMEAHRENAMLKAENKRLKGVLANVPRQYLIGAGDARQPAQLGPGMEYTRTDKWKALPDSTGKAAE